MNNLYAGIDPGLKGGIAIINHKREIVICAPMPITGTGKSKDIDLVVILDIFRDHYDNIKTVVIEEQHVMHRRDKHGQVVRQGVQSSANTLARYRLIEGALRALGLPLLVLRAQKWQKVMLAGTSPGYDSKTRSKLVARALFPDFDFTTRQRATRVVDTQAMHDGMTDAILMADLARQIDERKKA